MFLSDIIIYPIKSFPGVRVNESKVESRGLRYDRRWMLVDEDFKFLTLREHPEMLFFDLQLEENGFTVKDRRSGDNLELPWQVSGTKAVNVTIWKDQLQAEMADDIWSAWFEEKLGVACKLVYMPDDTYRKISDRWSKQNEIVSFADGYPLLVVGSASLADLNGKLEKKITIDRFRPNLVFEGGDPYEEFRWEKFKIGDVIFQGLKPCERCQVTTLDPLTGEKEREPLLTLSKQKVKDKIVFGQHAYADNIGTIHIDDNITVMTYKDSPFDPI